MGSTSKPLSDSARRRVVAAWTHALGTLPGEIRKDEWTFVERADLQAVVVVRVDGFGIAAAPPRLLDLVRRSSPESLLDAAALAKLLPAADPIGTADLPFAERNPERSPIRAAAADRIKTVSMREGVSPAEWDESGIEETQRRWTADGPAGRTAAIAGYARWRSELAQMAVLAHPQHRGAGCAYAAAAVATQEALGEGLIPQWRSRKGNEASRRLAQHLGFTQLGIQAAVALTRQ